VQGEAKQVCKNLSFTGSTLMAASRATLIYVIRFEYQAMKRLQKNER